MKILNVVCIVALATLFGCVNNEKETPNGFKFKVVKKGDGVLPKPGEIVCVQFTFLDSKDSIWGETKNGMPAPVMINDSASMEFEDGMTQMMRMISKGDSIVVNMPIKKFFSELAKSPIPAGVDSTLTLTYRIRVDTIMSQENYMTYRTALMEELNQKQLAEDISIIDNYLTEKGINAVKLESGLRYVITQPGKGENAKSGQTVKVNYTGYILEGRVFDSSIKSIAEQNDLFNPMRTYEPFEVTIDQSSVISGWHLALKCMSQGSKGTFYIPSVLAYGPQQAGDVIKENSVLVFDLEMIEVK